MPGKCQFFYQLQQRGVTAAEAKKWLKANPPPKGWKHSAWRWAFETMPAEGV